MLKDTLRAMRPNFNLGKVLEGAKDVAQRTWAGVAVNIDDMRRRMQNVPESNRDLVLMHYYAGAYRDSLFRLQIMRKIWGDSFFIHYNMGRNFYSRSEYDKARKHMDKALLFQPSSEEASYFLQKMEQPGSIGCTVPQIIKEYCTYNANKLINLSEEEKAICIDTATAIKNLHTNFSALDILDLGCGGGELGIQMRSLYVGRSITGVDFTPVMANHCKNLIIGGVKVYDDVLECDMHEALAKYDKQLDVIVAYRTFEMFGDLGVLLSLCKKALRPGGSVFFVAQRTRCSYRMQFAPMVDRFFYSDNYIEEIAQESELELLRKQYFNLKDGDNMIQCVMRKS